MHLGVFEEAVVALLQRYKHGNEGIGHTSTSTVHINDLWQSLAICGFHKFP